MPKMLHKSTWNPEQCLVVCKNKEKEEIQKIINMADGKMSPSGGHGSQWEVDKLQGFAVYGVEAGRLGSESAASPS